MLLNTPEFFLMNNPLRVVAQRVIEIPRIKKFVDLPKKSKVLEIGCGSGRGSQLIQTHFSPKKIIGIDLDPKMIAIAKKSNGSDKIDFQVADVTHLPFESNTFDAVFDFGIIHHVPNWKNAIEQIYRVAKPEGLLVLEDLSVETFDSPICKVVRKFLAHPYEQMYKQNQFTRYLKHVGAEILVEKTYTNLGILRYFVVVARKNIR